MSIIFLNKFSSLDLFGARVILPAARVRQYAACGGVGKGFALAAKSRSQAAKKIKKPWAKNDGDEKKGRRRKKLTVMNDKRQAAKSPTGLKKTDGEKVDGDE